MYSVCTRMVVAVVVVMEEEEEEEKVEGGGPGLETQTQVKLQTLPGTCTTSTVISCFFWKIWVGFGFMTCW